jgi:hypothetical protein
VMLHNVDSQPDWVRRYLFPFFFALQLAATFSLSTLCCVRITPRLCETQCRVSVERLRCQIQPLRMSCLCCCGPTSYLKSDRVVLS